MNSFMHAKRLAYLLVLCFIFGTTSFCHAQTPFGEFIKWTGGGDDMNWSNPDNWLGGMSGDKYVPRSVDYPYIVNGRTFIIENVRTNSLDIGEFVMGGSGKATVNLINGGLETISGITLTDQTGRGTLNIINSTLSSANLGKDYGGTGSGTFNVIGSKSSIKLNRMNYMLNASPGPNTPRFGELNTNFYFDYDGISTIRVVGSQAGNFAPVAGLEGNHLISAHGFTLQSLLGSYDLIVLEPNAVAGEAFGGTFQTASPFAVTQTATVVSVEFDDAKLKSWDIGTGVSFSGDDQLDNWLKIVKGDNVPDMLRGHLINITDDLAPYVVKFLSAGMPGGQLLEMGLDPSGDSYYVLVPSADFLDGDVFGWGLSGFNSIFDSDVRLTHFDGPPPIPEPVTLELLGLGTVAMFLCHRHRGGE